MSVILSYKALMLQGEIRCWSLLGFKGLREEYNSDTTPVVGSIVASHAGVFRGARIYSYEHPEKRRRGRLGL